MPDIFDEVAPDTTAGGDIFDDIAPVNGISPATLARLQAQERDAAGFRAMNAGNDQLLSAVVNSFVPTPPTDQQLREQAMAKAAGVTPIPLGTRLAAGLHSGIQHGMATPARVVHGLADAGLNLVGAGNTAPARWNADMLQRFAQREAAIRAQDVATFGANDILNQLAEGTGRAVTELPLYLVPGAGASTPAQAVARASAAGGIVGGGTQYAQDRGEGRPADEALPYAVASGFITALTTRAFGATGAEAVFRLEGIQGVRNRILTVMKDAGLEGAEEAADQIQQDILERYSRNPDKPIDETIKDVLMAGAVGSIVGGGVATTTQAPGAVRDAGRGLARTLAEVGAFPGFEADTIGTPLPAVETPRRQDAKTRDVFDEIAPDKVTKTVTPPAEQPQTFEAQGAAAINRQLEAVNQEQQAARVRAELEALPGAGQDLVEGGKLSVESTQPQNDPVLQAVDNLAKVASELQAALRGNQLAAPSTINAQQSTRSDSPAAPLTPANAGSAVPTAAPASAPPAGAAASLAPQISANESSWDAYGEQLRGNLESFSPARHTGQTDYDLMDVADRFVAHAQKDSTGQPLLKLLKDFAAQDDATPSQLRKLRESLKALEAEGIKPPRAAASALTQPPQGATTASAASGTSTVRPAAPSSDERQRGRVPGNPGMTAERGSNPRLDAATPQSPATVSQQSQQFDRLVREYGPIAGWSTGDEGFYDATLDSNSGLGSSVPAKVKASKDLQAARRRAASYFLNPGRRAESETPEGRAKLLPEFAAWLKQQYPDAAKDIDTALGSKETLTFNKDIRQVNPKTEPLVPDDLKVGDSFTLKGARLEVTDIRTDADGNIESITLSDGKKYGTQVVNGQRLLRMDKGSLERASGAAEDNVPFAADDFAFDAPEETPKRDGRAVNRELNRLKAKVQPTEQDKFRIYQLEKELGQEDLALGTTPVQSPRVRVLTARRELWAERLKQVESGETQLFSAQEARRQLASIDEELAKLRPQNKARLTGNTDETTGDMFGSAEHRTTRQDKTGQGSLFAAGEQTSQSNFSESARNLLNELAAVEIPESLIQSESDAIVALSKRKTDRAIVVDYLRRTAINEATPGNRGINGIANWLTNKQAEAVLASAKKVEAELMRRIDKAASNVGARLNRHHGGSWYFSDKNGEVLRASDHPAGEWHDGGVFLPIYREQVVGIKPIWELASIALGRKGNAAEVSQGGVEAREPSKALRIGGRSQGDSTQPGAGVNPQFSQGTAPAKGLPREQVQRIAAVLGKEMPRALPVTVLQTPDEFPAAVKASAQRQGVRLANVKGTVFGGRVYLVASNLSSPAEVRSIWLHEQVGHFATDEQLQGELRGFMENVARSFADSPIMAEVKRRYPKADNFTLGREIVAKLAENPQAEPNLWRRLVALVKAWLRKLGWTRDVSDNDVRVVLARAAKALKGESRDESRGTSANTARGVIEAGNATVVAPWARAEYALTAHHGTPHKVDKFTTAKIGTGEGAQVYGWGLYFAENDKVAEDYKKNLTEREFISKVRELYDEFSTPEDALAAINDPENKFSEGQRRLLEALQKEDWLGFDYPHQAVQAAIREPENVLVDAPETRAALNTFGNKYTVSLNVEPDELLDWDKPLGNQSEEIRHILRPYMEMYGGNGITGQQLYAKLLQNGMIGTPKRVSGRLLSDGIKGIRYLDQGSRAIRYEPTFRKIDNGEVEVMYQSKDGKLTTSRLPNMKEAKRFAADYSSTYNYVIFDENDITITHENGKPVNVAQLAGGDTQQSTPNNQPASFAAGEANPEMDRLQTEIAQAEAELMAAIRAHMNTPKGTSKRGTLAAKNEAAAKLRRLMAEQLKLMTSANVDAARSPEQTAEMIGQTVDLLNSIQDEISERTARNQEVPADLTKLRQDLQTRLNLLKGWTNDQTEVESRGAKAERETPRDARMVELESATDPARNTFGEWWEKLKRALRYLTSPIPELPLRGEQSRKSALFRRGYRLFAVENDRVRKEAAEKVQKVLEPLTKLGRTPQDNAALKQYFKLGEALQRAKMDETRSKAIRAKMTELEARLNQDPFNLFRRLVLYRDLWWRGTYLKNEDGKPITLPMGLSVDDVRGELRRITAAIEAHKDGLAITEALRRHYALTDELQKSILEHGEIIPESLRNPLFFPHHVLEYWKGNVDKVRPSTDEDFRRYLITPVGSGKTIQSDYLKAMYLHTADVLAHNARVDLVEKYWKPYDLSDKLKVQHGADWNKPWNLPPGYKLFAPYKKIPLRTDYILSREVLAEKLGVLFNDGDLRERMGEAGLVLKVKPEDLHAALVAGEKIQWVLPAEIADALTGIARREAAASNPGLGHAIGLPFRAVNNFWKKTKLFAPWNWIRYEYGNLSTDAIDKVLAADPGAAKHLARAAREIWTADTGEQSPEYQAAQREGVFDTITAGEAGELTKLPEFKAFLTGSEARWGKVRSFLERPMRGSKFREAVFRYAKFLADVERLRSGKEPVYAGAFHGDIEALGEDVDGQRRMLEGDELIYAKAAEISLKTYGDYNSLGVAGQWLRQYAVPFWSWQDVNFRYHANQLRNIADGLLGKTGPELNTARKAALRYAGVRVVSTLLAIGIAKELWNQFGGPMLGLWDDDDDLEAKLSEADRRRGHLILGKDKDGKVLVVYTPSAWSDVAEWMGGQNMKRLFMEYVRGQITLDQFVKDYAKQMPADVLNKLGQSLGPLGKAPYEAISGKSTFPDVLDQRTIPESERWWRLVGTLTDDRAVNVLRGAFDHDYYSQPAAEQLQQIILQIRRRDPEQWSYYEAREDAADWKEARTGKRFEQGSYDAPEAQALRNFRKSIYRGDVASAERFYGRLLQFGYTAERLDASIRNQHPLSDLNETERAEYIKTLSQKQRQELELATKYYNRIKALDGRERQLFPRKGQKPNPRPELLKRIVEGQRTNK